jgi:hypothetical protein
MRFDTQISKDLLSRLNRKAHQEVDLFAHRHFRLKELREREEEQARLHTFNTIRAALSR